jgi:hypothetical protein
MVVNVGHQSGEDKSNQRMKTLEWVPYEGEPQVQEGIIQLYALIKAHARRDWDRRPKPHTLLVKALY